MRVAGAHNAMGALPSLFSASLLSLSLFYPFLFLSLSTSFLSSSLSHSNHKHKRKKGGVRLTVGGCSECFLTEPPLPLLLPSSSVTLSLFSSLYFLSFSLFLSLGLDYGKAETMASVCRFIGWPKHTLHITVLELFIELINSGILAVNSAC